MMTGTDVLRRVAPGPKGCHPASAAHRANWQVQGRGEGEMKLEDKVAVVTGASMGLGKAVAESLCENGARVVVNSRSLQRAETVTAELKARGFAAISVAADVATSAGNEALVEAAVRTWGRLDIMVNNAGISRNGRSLDLPEAEWLDHINLNLNGLFFGCQVAARQMVKQGAGGVIINIGSVYSDVGNKYRAAYVAAKHGVYGLTKALAAEWAPHGIRVVDVHPAYIQTPMIATDLDSAIADPELFFTDADIKRRTPLGRFGRPVDVSRVVAFLASDDAAYITGSAINIDGGWAGYGRW